MCGRFSLIVSDKEILRKRFKTKKVQARVSPRYNITPFSTIPVILNTIPDTIVEVVWGFLPHWMRPDQPIKAMINARAETILEKPFFKEAFRSQRCLVLADGFYEWQTVGRKKRPFRISMKDGRFFAFAGVWDRGADGQDETVTCAIITTNANELVQPIHHRMPVILRPSNEQEWLATDDLHCATEQLRPYAAEEMIAYEIGKDINFAQHEDPCLIKPLDQEKVEP